jgi:hypothetical protein
VPPLASVAPVAPLAVPEVAPCASSGRAWRLWAACTPKGGAVGPPGAQPLPQVLELAASKAADVTAFGQAGAAGVLADVRLYGGALCAAAVRELFVSSALLGAWGGLGPAQAGVWGSEGAAAPANAVLDDAPPQLRTASPPLQATAPPPPQLHAAPPSGAHRKRQADFTRP